MAAEQNGKTRYPGTSLPPGRLNGILEDIGAELGFTATSALAAWFGGMNLYVPAEARDDHPIAHVIGVRPYHRLVAAFGGEVLCLPEGRQHDIDIRDRKIAALISQGKGSKEIAGKTGLSERRVQQIRIRLENTGVLPMLWKKRYPINPQENTPYVFGDAATEETCADLAMLVVKLARCVPTTAADSAALVESAMSYLATHELVKGAENG